MTSKIEISHRTILFTIGTLLLLVFLLQVKEIIFWVFVSFILMSALKPSTDAMEHARVPRVLAAVLHYLLIITFVLFSVSSIIPLVVDQSAHFGESFPSYLHSLFPFVTIDAQVISQQLSPISSNLLNVTIGVFSNIIALFTIFVISFYLLLERNNLDTQLAGFMGEKSAARLTGVVSKIEERLGAWVRGQLTLALIIGFSIFIGLSFLRLPYAVPLAIIAGMLEIVPMIGPIISAVPAIIIAFTISPVLALATTAFYFLIQQAENHLVVPFVMKRAVGLPPLVTILALMIGGKLAGITGSLLAVPVVLVGQTLLTEYIGGNWSLEAHKPDSVSSDEHRTR